jgi:hypothetical protein
MEDFLSDGLDCEIWDGQTLDWYLSEDGETWYHWVQSFVVEESGQVYWSVDPCDGCSD